MSGYIGEFDCKMDDKGRVLVPAALKRQIPEESHAHLVINRGFEKCLTLFTKKDWQAETSKLDKLNDFNKEDRMFKRMFNAGATEIKLDPASRILIPKNLAAYAEIESELVFYAYQDKIEIWSKKIYDEQMAMDADQYAELGQKVMGKKNDDE